MYIHVDIINIIWMHGWMNVQLLQAWAAMKFRRAILLDYGPVDLIRLLGRRCRVVGLRRLPPSRADYGSPYHWSIRKDLLDVCCG
jgi:hypothetical protein